ncbi:MAG TPA: glycosyltransferase family 2 protein [Blastocatellia bacterium]|nr:glycosyltransferase family 2 protein [Blastocatellia bacterium]HMX24446.1 glycosyltransferase family 2 protein [Blastocatellia bacterium]HMY74411.1 glycosyltransferase family 2 protein [Blastocatellia bacterium]HMZ21883.1 glycosyltransferase family 2 protein [Blastocatellia bacterium]
MLNVSVVIPAFQAKSFIGRAVRSVLSQTSPAWEIVIVSDDGVDYGLLLGELGLADKRIRSVSTGVVGSGPANARNVGLDAAAGRIVAMLDADDALAPKALAGLVPQALEHGAAYSRMRIIEHATGEELPSFDRPLESGLVNLADILTSQIHSYAGIVFDRLRVGARWPSSRELWEDVHFFVKCFDYLDRIYHEAEPLYLYHRREGSICNRPTTGSEYRDAAEQLLARLDCGDTLNLQNSGAREVYRQFLMRALRLETTFLEDLANGRCRDYRDFVARRLPLFHQLG